jgi:hypothetical protein
LFVIPAQAQGCPENGKRLLYLNRNQLQVVMRGFDPRIHALASVASACREDVDGRIKSGHDDFELHDGHCIREPTRIRNFPGQPCAQAGIQEAKGRNGRPGPPLSRG